MKKFLHLLMILQLFVFAKSSAQDSLSLEDCKQSAIKNYAGTKAIALYKTAENYKLKNAAASYLPKLNLNAQATWQSSTTSISLPDLPFPINIEPPPNDQYKVVLDINQVIFDAGATKTLKEIYREETNLNVNKSMADQYHLEEQINQLYLNILFLDKQIEIITSLKDLLETKLNQIQSAVNNGVLLNNSSDNMKVEILKIEQQLLGLTFKRKSLIESLSIMCGLEIKESTYFPLPDYTPSAGLHDRPEERVFNSQKELNKINMELLGTKRFPKIYSFAQLGYGRPGMNFLNTEFEPFIYAGAVLTWNIWDWNQFKNDKQLLNVQNELIEVQEEIFKQNIELQRINELNNRELYEESILKSLEIVKLREKISQIASSQLDNGTITVTEYIEEVTAEKQAKIELETNNLLLLQSKLNLELIIGKQQIK